MSSDYGGSFAGYPTLPLVDLRTMEVVVDDCWNAASYEACITDNL